MKRILTLLLLIALPVWATVSISEEPDDDNITKITYTWISNASGIATGTTSNSYTGVILRVVFNPDDSAVPTAAYDVTVTDNNSADILDGLGADLSATATTQKLTAFSSVLNSKLRINVSNAGASAAGQVIVYLGTDEAYSFADSSITGEKMATALWSEIKSIASDSARAAASDSAKLDDVSLADVQSATTSDFHNIGGTDDDIPDADEVVEAAIAGNAVTWAKIDTGATGFVDVRKFGAVGDGVTDDSLAMATALAYSIANNATLYFPAGDYVYSGPINITAPTAYYEVIIKGAGVHRTILHPDGNGITVNSGTSSFMYGLSISGMSIVDSDGKAASSDTAIVCNYVNRPEFSDLYITGFDCGIYGFRTEGGKFDRLKVQNNNISVHLKTNVNGNAFTSCYAGSDDSIAVFIDGGRGCTWTGGEGGNCDVLFKVDNISQFTIIGGNFEGCDSSFIDVGTNSLVFVNSSRFMSTSPAYLARISGTSGLSANYLDVAGWAGTDVIFTLANANDRLMAFAKNRGVVYYAQMLNNSSVFPVSSYPTVYDTAIPTASSTYRGQVIYGYRRTGSAYKDRLVFFRQIGDTSYDKVYLDAYPDTLDKYRTDFLIDTTAVHDAQWYKYIQDHHSVSGKVFVGGSTHWVEVINDTLCGVTATDTTRINPPRP